MKRFAIQEVRKPVLVSVICDTCGKECKNTHIDVSLKFTFCDEPELLETICYNCYEERFEKKLRHVRDSRAKMSLKLNGDINLVKKESEGCGKYFRYGAGEFVCGGALHVDGKKKLCANCTKDDGGQND